MAISDLSKIGKKLEDYRKSPESTLSGVFEAFAALSISQLKKNLRDSGKDASGTLIQSIEPMPVEYLDNGNILVQIEMESYWDFVNQGVNGLRVNWGSDYLFRPTAQTPTTSGPNFKQSILDWMAHKNVKTLSWQNPEGETVTKMLTTTEDYEGAAFAIMRSVKRKGIEPTHFVDKFFTDKTIDELTEGIEDAIVKDLEQ